MPPKKDEVYLTKPQVQTLCELYHEEEHLWNVQSPFYFKKEKRTLGRTATLERIKDRMQNEHEDLPNFTSKSLI